MGSRLSSCCFYVLLRQGSFRHLTALQFAASRTSQVAFFYDLRSTCGLKIVKRLRTISKRMRLRGQALETCELFTIVYGGACRVNERHLMRRANAKSVGEEPAVNSSGHGALQGRQIGHPAQRGQPTHQIVERGEYLRGLAAPR